MQHDRVSLILNAVDLARQAGLDKDAAAAAEGDKDAGARLSRLGVAGTGAIRRKMSDSALSLKQRLALATLLKSMNG